MVVATVVAAQRIVGLQGHMARITKEMVDSLQLDQVEWDQELRGFGVRRRAGATSYVLKYRVGGGRRGRQRWHTIGKHGSPWTPETARREAKRLLGLIADGQDPASKREAEKATPDFGTIVDLFLEQHVAAKRKPSTMRDYTRLLRKFAVPALGSKRLDEITKGDIATFHMQMRKTPRQANMMLSVLSKLFNFAEDHGFRPPNSNPCRRIERYPENKRERYLSATELRQLEQALADYAASDGNAFAAAAIRLLVFTGCRLNEILTLRWSDIDFVQQRICLADSKNGARHLPLNAQTREVLASLPKYEDNPFVICGGKNGTHMVNLSKPWIKIRASANLPNLRLHDLRHSFASIGVQGGLSLPIIGKLLGHSQQATTARYAHLSDQPVQVASQQISAQIYAAMQTDQASIPFQSQNSEADT
jgi:integrase